MPNENNLTVELQLFAANKENWVRSNPGEFVVIVGSSVEGFFTDYESAFRVGLQKTDRGKNFLVKQIWAEEPVYLIY